MADARAKAVLGYLVDNYSRANFVATRMTDLGPVTAKGDSVDVPTQSKPTNRSATTRTAPESLSPSVSTLTASSELFYNVLLPQRDQDQLLEGKWPEQTGKMAIETHNIDLDQALINLLTLTTAYDTSATYHVNVAGDSLADDDVNLAEAKIKSADGVYSQNLLWVTSSFGSGSLKNISTYIPVGQQSASQGVLGIPSLMAVNGLPVVESNGIRRALTAATTAVSVTSNVATATVAAGHGFVPGMPIWTSGLTTNVAQGSPATISSVTATTIVYPLTAGDGALADGVGTITGISSMNLLIDRSKVFYALGRMPRVKIVADFESSQDGLQVYNYYGLAALAGSVYVVHSPAASV